MSVIKARRAISVENIQTVPKIASVAMPVGIWLQYDGSGNMKPLLPGANPVEGLNITPIASTDTDFASNKLINYDGVADTTDRFRMPVTNGVAANAVVGSRYNVYTDNYGLDVSAYASLSYITLAVSAFAVGHTITGSTSSATGVITSIGPTGTLVINTITGTFVTGETITDGTSSATAKVQTYALGGTQFEVTKSANAENTVEVKVVLTK